MKMCCNIACNQSDSMRGLVGLCATSPIASVFAARFNQVFKCAYKYGIEKNVNRYMSYHVAGSIHPSQV